MEISSHRDPARGDPARKDPRTRRFSTRRFPRTASGAVRCGRGVPSPPAPPESAHSHTAFAGERHSTKHCAPHSGTPAPEPGSSSATESAIERPTPLLTSEPVRTDSTADAVDPATRTDDRDGFPSACQRSCTGMITAIVLFFLISVTDLGIATRHERDRQVRGRTGQRGRSLGCRPDRTVNRIVDGRDRFGPCFDRVPSIHRQVTPRPGTERFPEP